MSDAGGDIEQGGLGGGGGGGDTIETEYENLGSRLQSSCAGICIGFLLFFGSFPVLYWNEGRAVERYDALNEAESQVTSVFNPWKVDNSNEGKLVHFAVNITNGDDNGNDNEGGTTTTLTDPIFGIKSSTALKLHRQAEMYQWVEDKRTTTQKTYGGGKKKTTTYSYSQEWKDYWINSNNFHSGNSNYQNPSGMEFTSDTFVANSIKIGAYELPAELINRINWEEDVTGLTLENITNEELRGRATSYGNNGYSFSSTTTTNYNSNNNSSSSSSGSTSTEIGDQRVYFRETPPSIITIVGVQSGGTLGAFVSETGEGGDVLLFKRGNLTSVQMFDSAEEENKFATWLIRLAGFAIMALGLYLVFRPIEVFADIIPCVGSIIGCGLVFMAVTISAALSLVTISIAWLAARPEIGAIVLCVSLAVVGLCALGVKKLGKRKNGKNDEDDDDFVASMSGGGGGKVVEVPPAAAAAPTVMAVEEPPTVYALPEGQIIASAPPQQQPYAYVASASQQQHYAYTASAPPHQQPTVTVTAEPYVPKY